MDQTDTIVREFKKVALGYFKTSKEFSEEEFSEILLSSKLAKSMKEAKEIVPYLDGESYIYSGSLGGIRELKIKHVKGTFPNKYKISSHSIG